MQDMAEGKDTMDRVRKQRRYVKIFANLKDFEENTAEAELKNDFRGFL